MPTAWIGDYAAFDHYQQRYHTESRLSAGSDSVGERFGIASRMSDAFAAVIDNHLHPSVDHFALVVTSRPAQGDGFRYLSKLGAFGFQPVSNTTTPTSLTRSLGVEGGSYGYTVLVPTKAGIGAVAVHILQGKVGALFYPAQCWSPIVFRDVGIDAFVDAIAQTCGVTVDGFRHY